MGEVEPSYPTVHGRLTGAAWAAPAAPLYVLVIRDQ